ncbi:histidine kinase [Microbacterium sp. SORGH_AS_0862]|uniref:histidine kinase n=1 Tax=Microbacterium sp. SORGH_AS_0862 TaxID=3041789 RepID=UPI00278FF3A0|nr:histidine kinase [Microbacterium sp. SORGH_AS_0862]MDQ1204197.1 peptidoglycan/LPS O-acetylase OafA/YrhL [Microbacterium sp. SORGH_AS_0862]
MRNDLLSLVAGGLVVLEGVSLAGLAVWQLIALAQGDTASTATAIALIVLTLLGAALVVAFGVAAARGRSIGRSGGIVVQLLVLAVAIGAVTGTYGHPLNGLQLGVPALIVLVLLISAARRAAQNARRED